MSQVVRFLDIILADTGWYLLKLIVMENFGKTCPRFLSNFGCESSAKVQGTNSV